MSSEHSSAKAETVEQTKQQIRGLVSEIAQLSKSNLGAEEYYAAFLQRIVSALAAVGGAVWMLDKSQLQLHYQINLSETLLDPTSDDAERHLNLLGRVVRGGEPQLIPPYSGAAEGESQGNPTRFLLVLAPLISDGKLEGVVEIFQRPDSQPATQRGYLRFLIQMCELAGEWLKSRKLQQFSDRHSLWAQADEFSRLVHQSLDVRETAYTISNEGRRLIGCDRVAVAVKRGNLCKIEAISGQDTIENRSNIISALNTLATRVVATGEPLWYEGVTEDLPPQVEEAIEHYVDESYAKSVTVLPLRKPLGLDEATDERTGEAAQERVEDREVIGALIIEQIESDISRQLLEPRADLVYEHATRAMSNAVNYNSVFLMPVWRAIGRSSVLVNARNLPKTLLATLVVVALLIVLFVFQRDFDLESRGVLQPVLQRDVFATGNGTVEELKVKDGDPVEEGQVLLRLVNFELEQEYERLRGDLERFNQRYLSVIKQKQQPGLTAAEMAQLSTEQVQLELQSASYEKQLEIVTEKQKLLEVKSPIKGIVILPWDAAQSLLHRPLAAGQVVMTIFDPTQQWEVELAMPERRMGHVNQARKDIKSDLDVSYILATDPAQTLQGTLRHVDTSTQMSEEEKGPVVKLLVDIDEADLADEKLNKAPRPGATLTAKVKCGRRSIGYTFLHEVIEWVQAHILF